MDNKHSIIFMKKTPIKFCLFLLIITFVFAPFLKTKAALYVPVACDSLGATCASESTLEGYTSAWQSNYGGSNILSLLGSAASAGGTPVSGLFAAITELLNSIGGNTMARSLLSTTIMPELIDLVVQKILGTGGDSQAKAGNIVQNWLDYTSNARIGGGQNFTHAYYENDYLNMPEPMRELLKENLDARYGQYGSDVGTEYKDVARYNYNEERKSDSDNPFEMSESSDLLLLLQPQNNYLGSHVLATNYQDLASGRVTESAVNEPLSNGGGFLNTKDGDGADAKVIPGSLAKDVYQQQIIQTINAAQNVKSWADAEQFMAQMVGSAIQGYLENKFNEEISTKPSSVSGHVFGNY
ncbi:MAG: hypothetical protein UT37_C0001G0006 [Parcubacteria group bacterium GW2011_GWA2_39_18]|nr:MAG: hypothetical protein UT37_C0001G0006 [Parcubacteria group bacterium GW2011_GWA2_39_18]